LSIPIAEPSTPAPTYAIPASSSSPCTVPSSSSGLDGGSAGPDSALLVECELFAQEEILSRERVFSS
jgi:hypothetical protein